MDETPGWTLEELVRRVGLALDGAARVGGYPGAPNGRVRDVPDQRAIRWYTTTGLVDRPIGGRGRGARYGRRHLSQLVAIKRLQAAGSSLAEVQLRLAGADDDTLLRLADLPSEAFVEPAAAPLVEPAAAPLVEPAVAMDGAVGQVSVPRTTARFWAAAPAPRAAPQAAPPLSGAPARIDLFVPSERLDLASVPLSGLRLPGGLLLVLPATPGCAVAGDLTAAEVSELAEAARPLLSALAERGLIPPVGPGLLGDPSDHSTRHSRPSRTEGAP